MKKKLLMPIAALMLLAGCDYNEENFNGLEDITQPTDVKSVDYTMIAADYAALSDNPKKNLYFSAEDPADNFIPAWLAKRYYTASPTSVARITFNYLNEASAFLKPYTAIPYIGLEKNEEYVPIYGEGYYAPYLTDVSVALIGSKLLAPKYPNAKGGDMVMVGYNYNAKAVPQQMVAPVVNYNFDALEIGDVTKIDGGWYLKAPADKPWKVASYNGNSYVQYSAYGAPGVCEAWLVTPEIKIEGTDKKFAFDITVGNSNADCLSVWISADFDGKDVSKATWEDITSSFTFPVKESGYSPATPAGTYALSTYAGKKVRIAFKYLGDGANKKTTTYQIDNVVVGVDIPKAVTTTSQFKLFSYDSKTKVWNEYVNKVGNKAFCPLMTDYTTMGAPAKAMYFSTTVKPEDYMPEYLKSYTPYAQNGDAKVLIYRYYNASKKLEAQAKEYIYSTEAGRWELNTQIVERIRQYAFDGKEWIYDPSLTITLGAKGDAPTAAFYQAITDWVKTNKGTEYVTSFGNNDYYYGGSAYNNNFDFRPSAWKGQNAAAYGGLTDDALKKLMVERLPEAFIPGLKSQYPKAEPAEGVNVIYTIKFAIYDGAATTPWTIAYKVTGPAEFTYEEGSCKELK